MVLVALARSATPSRFRRSVDSEVPLTGRAGGSRVRAARPTTRSTSLNRREKARSDFSAPSGTGAFSSGATGDSLFRVQASTSSAGLHGSGIDRCTESTSRSAFAVCSSHALGSTATRTEGRRDRPAGRSGGGPRGQDRVPGGQASDPRRNAHVRLRRNDAPAAARVSIVGSDGKPYGPAGAAIRKTKRDESYFYADDSFDVELPPGRVRMNVSGGLETIPQMVTVDAEAATELTVQMQHWVDMAARGWYSGDSHVHLHTGGPIDVTVAGRAGRRPGGGGQLRQSLRVEQRRR